MAIAGLHNFSILDSSFLGNSQSQASRQHGDGGRGINRASSILQMWRELEVEQAVSHAKDEVSDVFHSQKSDGSIADKSSTDVPEIYDANYRFNIKDEGVDGIEDGLLSHSQIGSHNVSNNFICHRSPDIGEVERERVRQIFREWMRSCPKEHPSNVSQMNDNARAEWFGQNEQERVRIIREGVQISNCQQRGACGENREDLAAGIGSQVDRGREGLVANHSEGKTEHIQRGVRRLRGRQALLDMLKKAERERQRELRDLLQRRAVSNFAHRNRIQSLLRGRFLRTERVVEDERATSVAASELGLLRQRQTVSGLREGFLSRLENSVCAQASSNHADPSSNSDNNGKRNAQTHQTNVREVIDEFWGQSGYDEDNGFSDSEDKVGEGPRSSRKSSENERSQETNQNEVGECSRGAVEVGECSRGAIEVGECSQEAIEVFDEQSELSTDESSTHGFLDQTSYSEANCNLHMNLLQSSIQLELVQDQFLETEETDCQEAWVESNQLSGIAEDMVGNIQESPANEWSQEILRSEVIVGGHIQENSEVWHQDDGIQESEHNLLDSPVDDEAFSFVRVGTSYLSDDDNTYNTEVRELLSRRRVSNLLHSGFRETLEQVLQSYAERQSDATIYLELDGTSSPTSTEEDLEQQHGDQNVGQGNAVEVLPFSLPSPLIPLVRSIWDQESHHDSWSQHGMHHHLGIEWEIIDDLRIDMASLQQRMNDMQRMLEACMDMQLELQRSIRQEVSAALNRSAVSLGVVEDCCPSEQSKWENVRKGICCICCDTNINSLLYRCGHMCTCSKCANRLVQTGGKCPMCQAPVFEVIRAYSLQ